MRLYARTIIAFFTSLALLALGAAASLATENIGPRKVPATSETPADYIPTRGERALADIEKSTAQIAERAHALDDFLRTSGWEGYSSVSIENDSALLVHAVSAPQAELRKQIRLIAASTPLGFQKSAFRMSDYNSLVDMLGTALGQDRSLMVGAGPAEDESHVEVRLLDVSGVDRAENIVRAHFAGIPVKIQRVAAERYQRPLPFANWRWADKSPYSGGIRIYHTGIISCSTGFSAKRNSDGKKVMLTAWHCNSPSASLFNKSNRVWMHDSKQIGSGSASVGYPSYSTHDVDAMYFSLPNSGVNFGSKIYVGNWTSAVTKLRKNAGNPLLGETLTSGGAISGGSANIVTKINALTADNIGRGFVLRSKDGQKVVGEGDSGGPVHRAYSDGTYGARGLVQGQGVYKNSHGDWVPSPLGLCAQGAPLPDRLCSRDSFNMNIETIEAKLDVTVYPS